MKLTKEQSEKLLKKLKDFGPPRECPICGSKSLSVSDTIFELREFQGGNLIVGGDQSIYPVIPINCSQCGQTFFLNAIIAGIIDPQKGNE